MKTFEELDVPGSHIIVPSAKREQDRVRLRSIPLNRAGKQVRMRAVVEFRLFGPLDKVLWKKLKLPDGWRKSPRRPWMDGLNFPVRIYSYHPASISADEFEQLQAKLNLMTGSEE